MAAAAALPGRTVSGLAALVSSSPAGARVVAVSGREAGAGLAHELRGSAR
jgi:hypothetical protein